MLESICPKVNKALYWARRVSYAPTSIRAGLNGRVPLGVAVARWH